jgi:hypothetical protein
MRTASLVMRRAAAVALAAVALVGCGSGGKGSGGASSLTFMSGGGAYQDAQDKAFIRPFERATGIRVYDDTTLSYAPASQKATLTDLPPELKEFLPNTNPKLAHGVVVQDQRWWAANADAVTRRWQQTFQG